MEPPDSSDNQNTGDAVAHPAHDPPQFTGYYNVRSTEKKVRSFPVTGLAVLHKLMRIKIHRERQI